MSYQKLLENLYDCSSVCRALLRQEEQEACRLFLLQAACLSGLPADERFALRRAMLVSLNHSIYNFILFHQNCSLSGCCFSNNRRYALCGPDAGPQTGAADPLPAAAPGCPGCCGCRREFEKAARQIIHAYAGCLKALCPDGGQRLAEICLYIREHLQEPLSLDLVASYSFLSRSQLCRLFRTHLNKSFSEYLLEERLAKARLLLLSSGCSVTRASELCGFSSPAYFATCFRKAEGCSPREFRKRADALTKPASSGIPPAENAGRTETLFPPPQSGSDTAR